ncbi:MAG: hypothetical protein KDB37_19135, partial [Ilumatobacter sp.]|nr:hypothetical protein [Ilumatobacter sp.]
LEILSSDLDLSSLAGVDIQIESQTIAVEPRADDIVMLSMSADVLATIDGAEVPIGEMITDRVPDDVIAEMRGSKVTESDTIELAMAAVEHDGAWYLSLFYTVAELARSESGLGGVPTAGIGAVGADSPEGVIDLFADHLSTLDIRGMLQMLDPAEAEALQRYAPLFLDEAERAIADEVTGLDVRVTDREVRVEGDGSARTLFIDAIGVEADIEGTHVTASFADGCVSFAYEDEYGSDSMEQCASSPDAALVEQMAGVEVPPTVDDFITSFTEAFADMEPIGLEVRERDGQWYVSPIATGTEALLAVMRALDRDELDELIDLGSLAADDFFDMAFGLVPGMMDEGWTTEEEWAIEDAPADPPDSMDGTGDLEGEWTEYEASPVDECYSIESATEATACFEEQIATGAVDEWEMPVSLTAPECGLTEVLWSGDVYSMSDDEFTATMTAAAPCFEALLAEGYDRWLIPYEVANLECFEGRNPYQVFDEDYTDRLFECAYGVGDSDGA